MLVQKSLMEIDSVGLVDAAEAAQKNRHLGVGFWSRSLSRLVAAAAVATVAIAHVFACAGCVAFIAVAA